MSATLAQTLPPNPATTRGSFTSISTDPTGTKLVYCQARTVVIRPLLRSADASAKEGQTLVYAQHAHPTTCARISPSGYYCASADTSGTVRIWDLAGSEQVLKLEVRALGGRITDLVWDGESKRIGVVGEGKDKFGHFFLADSGSSCGEVTGHSKVANALAIKTTRPYRAATAGDDGNIVFYNGVPFKYAKSINTHKGFVQALAYAPSGSYFVSAGSDGRLFRYDGATGDEATPLVDAHGADSSSAHRGTIFSCACSSDSSLILSCGADGLVKVWDAASAKLTKTFDLNGKNESSTAQKAGDQLVGCTFAEKTAKAVAVSLAGEINVIDIASGTIDKLHGATKAIGTGALVKNPSTDAGLLAGSYDGRVLHYDNKGACTPVTGLMSSGAAITGLAGGKDGVWVVGMDDTLRRIASGEFDANTSLAVSGQPRGVASSSAGGVTLVATTSGVDIIVGGQKTSRPSNENITAVACSGDGKYFALGREDSKVVLCTLDSSGNQLKDEAMLESGRSTITALAFSKGGALLAAGEGSGKINVYDVAEKKIKFNQWVFHTARINALQFSPDGTHAVSASLDTNVYVWSTLRPMKSIAIKNAFAGGAHGACWLDDERIASAGADGTVKVHTITRHA